MSIQANFTLRGRNSDMLSKESLEEEVDGGPKDGSEDCRPTRKAEYRAGGV